MTWRDGVERVADDLEMVARTTLQWRERDDNQVDAAIARELFARAHDLKQYARAGTPSEGI